MEHLALEIFDLDQTDGTKATTSKYANLPEDASITITDTSEIFASGDVWSHSFTLNVHANSHIFGTAGDIHGSRLHEQINKRRARLWVEGLPLYLGYLKLDDEVDVDENGDVDVTFESGQKTFDEMIEGTSAQEVSVGDVEIGVALNRKRNIHVSTFSFDYKLDEHASFPEKTYHDGEDDYATVIGTDVFITQRWPKLVLSKGTLTDLTTNTTEDINAVNVQTAYDDSHPYCNINICYQKKEKKNKNTDENDNEEVTIREYVVRLASGKDTTNGGDNEVRFNNSPNFYLLYWLKRLLLDKGVYITENQALDVEDLRRVFLVNMGCFYEEKDTDIENLENYAVGTADYKKYGKYSFPGNFVSTLCKTYPGDDDRGSVLMRNGKMTINGSVVESYPQASGSITSLNKNSNGWYDLHVSMDSVTGYKAFATGDNYPNVNVSDVIDAMKAAFGVRFLFNQDYNQVRIVLLRNIFRSKDVQTVCCEVVQCTKEDNGIRGFRMTYNGGEDDTNYNYNDWKYATTNVSYEDLRQRYVTSFNKNCYINAVTGNAYRIKIDEEESVFFPALFEVGGYNNAEDGDCTGEEESIDTVSVNATPMLVYEIDGKYALFYSGEMKAPGNKMEIAAQIPVSSTPYRHSYEDSSGNRYVVTGDLDVFIKEGYIVALQDNYDLSGIVDSPFDNMELGLMFGIMRGSGSDSRVKYEKDEIEGETPRNDWWEVVPGNGAVSHPDTCDNYGNEWDYNGDVYGIGSREGRFSLKLRAEKPNPYYTDTKLPNVISTKQEAGEAMQEFYTTANTNLLSRPRVGNSTMRAAGWNAPGDGYATVYSMGYGVASVDGLVHEILWTPIKENGTVLTQAQLESYIDGFNGLTILDMVSHDTQHLILDIDTTEKRAEILHKLQAIYYATEGEEVESVDISYLKNRRTTTTTETYQSNIAETKEDAKYVLSQYFTSSNVDLFYLLLHDTAFYRSHGWNVSGDVFFLTVLYRPSSYWNTSIIVTPGNLSESGLEEYFIRIFIAIMYNIGWQVDIEQYREEFYRTPPGNYLDQMVRIDREGLFDSGSLFQVGGQQLILDVNSTGSTNERKTLLDGLLQVYYADVRGKTPTPVTLPTGVYIPKTREVTITVDTSSETTAIAKTSLRGRGLADQFYKEYSYWIRNARIMKMKVRMELAQLLAIDKTVRVTVGDVTGFIRKMQYSVSNKTGLGEVTMEIMYI